MESVSGSVTDQSGAVVAGATVRLLGTDTGLTRSAESTGAGEFAFQDLPLGRYSLSVNQAGFQAQNVKDINVEAGKIFNLKVYTRRRERGYAGGGIGKCHRYRDLVVRADQRYPHQGDHGYPAEWPGFYAAA